MQQLASIRTREHLTPDNTIRDLLNHPAFARFGRLLLPWDDRADDTSMPLRNIGSLLPYHSHVDSATVVGALNHMIGDVNSGNTVFYDFYTEEEKKAQPTTSDTGLFLFRGKPGAPFAVIAPGGGFAYVGSVHEGFPYAVAISRLGYNAFVLKYRTGSGGALATRDFAAAISFVFRNARTLGVSTKGYSLWGSSAGARMAAAIGSDGVARFGGDDLPKPSAVVMAYTGHSSTRPTSHLPLSSLASMTGLPLLPSWKGELLHYARPERPWSSIDTVVWVMASVLVLGQARKDGSSVPSDSGRSPSAQVPRASLSRDSAGDNRGDCSIARD